MVFAVFSYKLALHETHVGLKSQGIGEASASALPEDMDPAYEAVEIGDFGRVIDFAQRLTHRQRQRVVVNGCAKRNDTSGDVLWFAAPSLSAR
jgi:hypothetical protein